MLFIFDEVTILASTIIVNSNILLLAGIIFYVEARFIY